MAGGLTISTLNDSTGVLATQNGMRGVAKAWVNFSGVNLTINNSFNVSSVTRQGTGYYSIAFSTAMPSAFYSVVGGCKPTSGQTGNNARAINVHWNQTPTTGGVYFVTATSSAGYEDFDQVYITVNGA